MWSVKPLIVLGGPGTGKTTFTMNVIEELLASGVKPQEIAFVSYTRKAVEEAKHRAAERFSLSRRAMDNFRTIHSLCYRDTGATQSGMMGTADYRELAASLGLRYKNRIEDSEEPVLDGSIDAHLTLNNYARSRRVPDKQIWDATDQEFGWFAHRRVIETLREYKLDNGKQDFTDLLEQYLERGEPQRVRVAILDEAQDLSTLQWLVAQRAFSNVERVYIAGDDDQAIFKWSGADVSQFVSVRGTEHVLPHSYRLPRSVHDAASRLVHGISQRRRKSFSHTGSEGTVQWVVDVGELPIESDSGSWMLLARNRHQLSQFKQMCHSAGVPYRTANGTSLDEGHIAAIVGWERMRKGENIDAELAKSVVAQFGRALRLPQREVYTTRDFYKGGTPPMWHDALIGISAQDLAYYLNILRNGFSITRRPEVYIGTIHSVKGGEADNVVLLTDVSSKSYQALQANEDDERRVFYVGMTRARNALYLVAPQTQMFFPV